jgi:hypothetical protein
VDLDTALDKKERTLMELAYAYLALVDRHAATVEKALKHDQ